MPVRTLKASGVTPRSVMLVGWLSVFLGLLAITTISHDASGVPLLSRAMRGSVMMVCALPMLIHDVSSDSEPRWVTMALLSEPVERSAAWKPADIDAITTTAATTSAMPKIASSVTFQRWPRLRML